MVHKTENIIRPFTESLAIAGIISLWVPASYALWFGERKVAMIMSVVK